MRVATWNMGYWGHARTHDAAWHWLFDELAPDIAFLQECIVPEWISRHATVLFERAYPSSKRQRWGTALVTRGVATVPTHLEEIEDWFATLDDHPEKERSAARLQGWCVAAQVSLPGGISALVISIHNPSFPISRSLVSGRDLRGIKLTLSSDVWLLDVVFAFLRHRLNKPLLIGGDFNYSRLLDVPKPRGNAEFFDRLTDEGFVSLHRCFHDADEQTFFHPNRRKHQLDYLYSDATLAQHVTYCEVVPRGNVELYSDHAPLVAEFVLG
jgi:exonuclease III